MTEPTVVDIRGVDVKFPFKPYSVQSVFMEKVMEALQDRKNALLESPTGTGKTFSLLCSTLAWAEAESKQVHYRDVMPKMEQDFKPSGGGMAGVVAPEAYRKPRPRIIYASRTHSQLAQVAQELKRTVYRPITVVLGSRAQLCTNPKVREKAGSSNAAITTQCQSVRSSGGCFLYKGVEDYVTSIRAQLSGLTLRSSSSSSMAMSSLDHAKKEERDGTALTADKLVRQGPPLTQTTILDIEELKSSCRSSQPACPYYSSRKLSVHADLILMPYNYLIDPSIRNTLGIPLKGSVIIIDEGHNVPGVCMDAGSFDLSAAELAQAMRDMDDLVTLLQNKPGNRAEVALGGLGDSNGQGQGGGTKVNVVVTVDDVLAMKKCVVQLELVMNNWFVKFGGDVSGRARRSGSAAGDGGVTRPGHEIHELIKEAFNMSGGKLKQLADTLTAFTLILAGSDDSSQHSGQSAAAASSGSNPLPPPGQTGDNGGGMERQSTAMKELAVALEVVSSTPAAVASKVFRMHLAPAKNQDKKASTDQDGETTGKLGVTLHFWCFDPSIAMGSLMKKEPNSLILTSGTLAPLDSFAAELGAPFAVRLESPHVIPSDQILVSVCGMGPDGSSLKATYANRSTPQFLRALGNTVVNVIRNVPHGVLVFFPSYSMMSDTLEWWKVSETQSTTSSLELRQSRFSSQQSRGRGRGRGFQAGGQNYFESHTAGNANSIWNRIRKLKKPIVEPTAASEFNDVMASFYQALADPGSTTGAIFFAVCRGKVAEGIDFSNDNARAVIVVGMPFASLYDPWVKEKRAYQDRVHATTGSGATSNFHASSLFSQGDGGGRELAPAPAGGPVVQQIDGQTWYTQEAIRAVNQAIGRVIRHRNDYGAILLCDPRFNQSNIARQLSKWIQQHCFAVRSFGELVRPLCKFYKRMSDHSFDDASVSASAAAAATDASNGLESNGERKPAAARGPLAISYEQSASLSSSQDQLKRNSSQGDGGNSQRMYSSSQSESVIDDLRASVGAGDLASASPLLASIVGKARGNASAAVAAVVASGSVIGDKQAADQAAGIVLQSSRASSLSSAAAQKAGDGGGSSGPGARQIAKQFLEELKVEVDSETFAEFRSSMAKYKNPQVDFGLAHMVEKARSLFSSNPKLLLGFLNFLPSKHRHQYESVFREDIAAMLYNGTGDSYPRPRPLSSRPSSSANAAASVLNRAPSPAKRRRIKTFDIVTGQSVSKIVKK